MINNKKIGFASLAMQAGVDPTLPYPHANGTFPISFVTIVGEWAYLVDVCNSLSFISLLFISFICLFLLFVSGDVAYANRSDLSSHLRLHRSNHIH